VGEQLSAVVRSQATQVPPPTPQLATDSGMQVPLAQQPLGHDWALHRHAPPTHSEPLPHEEALPQVHAPVTGSQPLLIAGSQATQLRPPIPQAAAAGTRHTPAAQQPLGHDSGVQTQAPAWQDVPAPQAALAPQ
jgi:hypothetical protein